MKDDEIAEDEKTSRKRAETNYAGKASLEASVRVTAEAEHDEQIILSWRGQVSVFRLTGSKQCERCFVWRFRPQIEVSGYDPDKAGILIAPDVSPVISPIAAVKDFIIHRYAWSESVNRGIIKLRVDPQ